MSSRLSSATVTTGPADEGQCRRHDQGRARMITGLQAREACDLLRWTRYDLNRRTALPLWLLERILSGQGDLDVTPGENTFLTDAFDRAGVEFVVGGDGQQNARLKRPPRLEG